MEAHQERVDDSDPHGHEWSGFPELRIDPKADPYAQTPAMWSATSQHLLEVAIVASGAGDLDQLSARLNAAQNAIEAKLADARQAGAAAALSGWGISPAMEPGLTVYALSPASITEKFPRHEVYAAVAVWLLIEGHRAAMGADRECAARWEAQALVNAHLHKTQLLLDLLRQSLQVGTAFVGVLIQSIHRFLLLFSSSLLPLRLIVGICGATSIERASDQEPGLLRCHSH